MKKSGIHDDFAKGVSLAFRKRSRAISRRGVKSECMPVKELIDGKERDISRIDLSFAYRVDGNPTQLRVHVWGDRYVWIDVRRASKAGWIWEFTFEGRFISTLGPGGLMKSVEETIDASLDPPEIAEKLIPRVWSRHLATGPRPV